MNATNVGGPFQTDKFVSTKESSVESIIEWFKACLFDRGKAVIGLSSSCIVWYEPIIGILKYASEAWCIIPDLLKISKPSVINRGLQRAGLRVAITRFSIQRVTWLPVRSVNIASSRYGRNNRMVETIGSYSRYDILVFPVWWVLSTDSKPVRVCSCHSGTVQEHILLVPHMHLFLRCSLHSASARRALVVIRVFLSGYVIPEAYLLQEVPVLLSVCYCDFLKNITGLLKESGRIFWTGCQVRRKIVFQWSW